MASSPIAKYGYEEYKRNIRLRENIDEDIEPYDVVLPDRPFYTKFINYGLAKEQQFFKYEEKPKWLAKLNKMPRDEAVAKAKANPEYGEWIESQWEKRRNGVFMYIYGKPLFIPGKYWFFLNYNPLKRENPDFRWPDLEEAYWWDFCVEQNPKSYGGLVIAMRRDGKSAKAGAMQLEYITRCADAISGILSKTGGDAIDFFDKNIVKAWRRLPFFFSPKFDNKTYPKKELILRGASKGGDDLDASDLIVAEGTIEDLDSRIEARTTKETSFDGEQLGGRDVYEVGIGLVIDEAGKWEDVDVYQTVMIHKECLNIREDKIGKMYVTSTVEQITPKGLVKFKQVVDDSSRKPEHNKINDLGETVSGLSVFFKPAWETYKYDKWGFSIIGEPTEAQSEWLKEGYLKKGQQDYIKLGYHKMGGRQMLTARLEGIKDPAKRQAFMSRYPFSLKEAFTSVNRLCPFEAIEIIQQRLLAFRHGDPFTDRFNIEVDENSPLKIKPRKVVWNDFGRFSAPRKLIEYLEKHKFNAVGKNEDNFLIPLNDSDGLISSDPFKYNETEGTKKSNGALTAFYNYDAGIDGNCISMDDWVTEDWGIHYCMRPRSIDEYCDDAINLCHLTGMKILTENNVDNVRQYFHRKGYSKFLKFRTIIGEKNGQVVAKQAAQAGIQTSSRAEMDSVMASTDSHLLKHGHRCKFKMILESCRDLDPNDWSPYDSYVTAGRSEYYRKQMRRAARQEAVEETQDQGFTGMGEPNSY